VYHDRSCYLKNKNFYSHRGECKITDTLKKSMDSVICVKILYYL
jgi:hypothetical protein